MSGHPATPAPERSKAFWVKCRSCSWIWPAAYYPQPMHQFAKIIGKACCPSCGNGPKGIFMAKQDNGVLQEPLPAGTPAP